MNLTLHLTNRCNLNCRYCFEHEEHFGANKVASMSEETAMAAVDLVYRDNKKANGFALFGGEPMLERALIERIVAYANQLNRETGCAFDYKMTTNGLLLDEEFLRFASESNIDIALSHDGLMHDTMRVFPNGAGSSAVLNPKTEMLLHYQPNALVMCTVTPQTVSQMADSVLWLADQGFQRIVTTIDYRPDAGWNDSNMEQLREQYEAIGWAYIERFGSDRAFRYLNFEVKIKSYIMGKAYCGNNCRLGKKQPSVATDGVIYPCIQFVGAEKYAIGNVFNGIDPVRQEQIFHDSQKKVKSCEGCALQSRCRYHCSCLNYQLTGDMNTTSPVQCTQERILIPVADHVASTLYQTNSSAFLTAYYQAVESIDL